MIGLSYEDIITKIKKDKNLSDKEINERINLKLKKLSDLISKEGAAHIVANELGIKLFDINFKINKIRSGMTSVNIIGKVIKIYGVREFKKGLREGKVANLLIGDETGISRLVFWDTKFIRLLENNEIKENDILKLRNCYVKVNNGYKELHLGNRGQVTINPDGIIVDVIDKQNDYNLKKIRDLNVGDFTGIFGTIVQVFEPKIFEACAECGKKVINEDNQLKCAIHGNVAIKKVPILNFFFDDGSGSIRSVVFRDQVGELMGLTNEQVINLENFDDKRSELLGKQVVLVGRVNRNEMFDRNEFNAQRVVEVNPEEVIKMIQ